MSRPRGFKHTPETRRRIGEGNRGKKRTLETRKKLSEAKRGKKRIVRSLEHRRKISEGAKERYRNPKNREKLSRAAILGIKEGRRCIGQRGKQGHFYSRKNNKNLHYRSLLELYWYQLLEQMEKVKWYEVEPIIIPYLWEGFIHRYLPDLLVKYTDGTMELIEIKPEFRWEDEQNQAKWRAARKWCENRKRRQTEFKVVGYERLEGRIS